ncbi:CopG family transcriptional regulator [Actinomyces succiniciruminis]|uniref:Ribbon-helix-helix n=1 Tax=Actinomyces succiniciruminis TaxID=1522002 RepID=A0A1L7RS72_9ACTO|nr:CopG family transcriptional regulator [Actinomyces succiniciruminis]CED92448.1 Ribbon-helix-helix [Actinomyces succiniciruminis]
MTNNRITGTLPATTTDDELDTLATQGKLRPIGQPLGGGDITSEGELKAIMSGRPTLGHDRATGRGASARRQVRLPETTNTALDAYATKHGMTPSAVIRQALDEFLASA